MAWLFLFLAIVLEVAGTTCMKLSNGFTNIVPTVLLFIFYGLSFYLLSIVLKTMDLSITYAIWSAVGMALVATVGILYFKEPATALKMVSLGLVILGVVGLSYSTAH